VEQTKLLEALTLVAVEVEQELKEETLLEMVGLVL
jgi:hypothetical protein